ncbi:O-antigen ligase family protein [Glaciimonas sp. GNP009]
MKQLTFFKYLIILGAPLTAGVLGLLLPFLPWWLPVGLGLVPVVTVVVWVWPSAGLVFLLMMIFGIIPSPNQKLTDLATLMYCIFIFMRRWSDVGQMIRDHKRQLLSLMILVVCVLFSAIYGYFYNANFRPYVYNETMVLMYWMLFPATALLVVRIDSANEIFRAVVGLAVLFAALAVAQSVLGVNLNFSKGSRLEGLDAASGGITGLARSIVPGTLIILFAFYCALVAILRREGRTWLWVFVLLISMSALFVNFGRGLWAVTFVGSFIVAMLMGWRSTIRLFLVCVSAGILLISVLAVLKPEVLSALVYRVTSIRSEGGINTSFGWRLTENQFAWAKISANPVLGIGFGGEYKPRLIPNALFTEQTRYIHNAYLYILLKMGVIGLLVVLFNHVLLVCSVARGREFRESGTAPRLAAIGLLVAVLLLSFTQPELFSPSAMAALAVLIPIALRIRIPLRYKLETSSDSSRRGQRKW